MTFSKAVVGLCLAALLGACGGGSDDPPGPPVPPRDITITQPHLSAETPVAYAGHEVRFDGGTCGGGNGRLTVLWHFDDNTPDTHTGTHTYLNAGSYLLRVKCTDGSGNEYKFALTTQPVQVLP